MLTQNKQGICEGCKEIQSIGWTDSVGREYCIPCFMDLHAPSTYRMLEHLTFSIPYQVGQRVRCYTAATLYDGIGTIDEISIEPEKYGTPVYPSFHVTLTQKAYPEAPDSLYYTEACLKPVVDE